jgi:hypothetical protein
MAMMSNAIVGATRWMSQWAVFPGRQLLGEGGPFLIVGASAPANQIPSLQIGLRLRNGAPKLQIVRRVSAIAVVLLVVSWVALPALACMLPGRGMTPAEHACCRKMPKMCGSMRMPQSHSCCEKEVQSGSSLVVATSHHFAATLQVIGELPTLLPPPASLVVSSLTQESPPSDSPPGSAVLRI